MALLRAKRTEIPQDAVILSESEAVEYQLKIISKWKNRNDTFFFRNGASILGLFAGATGIYINNYYRIRFLLLNYGRGSSYLPATIVPAILAFLFHGQFVTSKTILYQSCTVCNEIRAAAIQAFTGCIIPLTFASLSSLSLAMMYHTYDVPYFTKQPLKVFQLWRKQTSPIGNILFAIFVGQALIASTVTYLETNDVVKVNERLDNLQRQLENSNNM